MFKLFELTQSQAQEAMIRNPRYHEFIRGRETVNPIAHVDDGDLPKNDLQLSIFQQIFSLGIKASPAFTSLDLVSK